MRGMRLGRESGAGRGLWEGGEGVFGWKGRKARKVDLMCIVFEVGANASVSRVQVIGIQVRDSGNLVRPLYSDQASSTLIINPSRYEGTFEFVFPHPRRADQEGYGQIT